MQASGFPDQSAQSPCRLAYVAIQQLTKPEYKLCLHPWLRGLANHFIWKTDQLRPPEITSLRGSDVCWQG